MLTFAAYVRSLGSGLVFPRPGEAIALDPDALYHVRRAFETLRQFPTVPARDPFLDWPTGAAPPWGPGFDQLLALVPYALGLGADDPRAARVMMGVPIVLGVVLVALVMRLAFRVAPAPARRGAALAAGMLAATTPNAVYASRLGATDHHVVEALFVAGLALVLVARPHARGLGARVRWELALSVLLAVGVHVYTGTVMPAGLAVLGLLLTPTRPLAAVEPSRRHGDALLGSGAPAFASAAVLLLTFDQGYLVGNAQPFHHLALSYLQPTLLALGACALGVDALLRRRIGATHGRGLALHFVASSLASGSLVCVAALALPHAASEVRDGLVAWLGKADPWMASIAESAPLFHDGTRLVRWAFGASSIVVLPAALVVATRGAHRTPSGRLPLLVVFAGLLALALLQNRFTRPLLPLVLAHAGVACALVARRVVRTMPAWRPMPALVAPALAAAAVALDPEHRDTLGDVAPGVVSEVNEACFLLRERAPSALASPRRGVGQGVLAGWPEGHAVIGVAKRPTLVAGFGPYTGAATFHAVEAAFGGAERDVLRLLDGHDAGHVLLTTAAMLVRPSPRGRAPVRRGREGTFAVDGEYLHEIPFAAALLGGSGAAAREVPHFEQLRPIYVSRTRQDGLRTYVPTVLVFERVKGAELIGEAPDGTLVVLSLDVSLRDVTRRFEAWTRAHEGRFALRTPLPTGWSSGAGVRTADHATLAVGDRTYTLAIPEDAVARGETRATLAE